MRIGILGFGTEGRSVLNFLADHPLAPKSEIWVLDENEKVKVPSRIKGLKIQHELGRSYMRDLERFDVIIRSPGIPFNTSEIQNAMSEGVEVTSATKLFFEHCRTKIIGITGTKGKSTTTHLIWKVLATAGYKTLLGGNIGTPMLDTLEKAQSADFVVLELSSFQLQDLERSPDISVVLDVFPDHLDAHRTLSEYISAKVPIARYQKTSDTIFAFGDNEFSKEIASRSPGKKIFVSPLHEGLGKNREMVEYVARFIGVPERAIHETFSKFKGLEHRLEFVRTKRTTSRTGKGRNVEAFISEISFYNDSFATNPTAAALAIEELDKQCDFLILIAGGRGKNLDYSPLAQALKKSKHVVLALLYGENKDDLRKELAGTVPELDSVKYLSAAVNEGFKRARSLITMKRDELRSLGRKPKSLSVVVLLSPASTSFDMFKNARDRGETFKKLVRRV
jgi:UDP-N-acetylmuramoylalanine--D-glutamate ligase